jgi:hypothetical protein
MKLFCAAILIAAINASQSQNRALISAASKGDNVEVNKLIQEGANVNTIDGSSKQTALLSATFNERNRTVDLLLSRNANPDASNIHGQTALHLAVKTRNEYIVDSLLTGTKRASVNAQTNRGHTPLMYAAEANLSNIIKILLDAGADPTLENSEGKKAADLTYNSACLK